MKRALVVAVIGVLVLSAGAWFAQARGAGSVVRTYYIAADELEWDYAPNGSNLITGREFTEEEKQYVEPGPQRMGSRALKAVYREYTDSTFSTLKPRAPEWEHLGVLGPLIRATVGDTIRIVFRNNAHFPASMHPHGVFYNKDSEGAVYADDTNGNDKSDDGVPTGGTHVYTWAVPERAGPTDHEGSTAFWMYHSHVDELKDVNTGLIGPMIITRRGMANADGSPKDVDRELVAAFAEFDENMSHLVQHNIDTYYKDPKSVKVLPSPFAGQGVIPGFDKNFKETINGYLHGNGPGFQMRQGERVRWYVMASTNFEFHAPHWHGNVVTIGQMRTDVASITSMEMVVADMVADNPGKWLFHCHNGPHMLMGMSASFTVAASAVAE